MTVAPAAAHRDYAALAALVVLLAVVFLNAPGSPDMDIWMAWQRRVLRFGLVDGYARQAADYPPLSFVLLWLAGKLAEAVGVTMRFGIKLVLLVFLLASLGVVHASLRSAKLTAAFLWLALPSSVALGYLDVWYAPMLLGAVWALRTGRPPLAVLLFTCACLVKWQPLVLAPFLLVHLARHGHLSSARASARVLMPSLALVAALLAVFGAEVFRAFARALLHPNLSAQALNFQWVITYLLRVFYPETFGELWDGVVWRLRPGTSSALWAMRIPFAVFYLSSLWVFARRARPIEELLSLSFVGYASYFMFATGVHENHLFPACLVAFALAGLQPGRLGAYLLWTTVANVNMYFYYGVDGIEPTWSRVLGIDLSVLLAAANVVLFLLLFLERVWDEARAAPPAA
jgi:hypothetical protein